MIKVTLSKYVNEDRLRWSLILITVLSWFLFPLELNQLNPSAFNIGFSLSAFAIIIGVTIGLTRNQLTLQLLHKMMLICWIGYLLALLLATIESASAYSIIHWCILFAKFLFFAFLLFYINKKFIVTTLRIYANLMVLTVFFAVVAIIVAALGYLPLATVDLHGTLTNFYFGSYYTPHYSPICAPAPIYRIQGLSEEPGTLGFALLPAFFWFVIAEKAYVRSAAIAIGISLTMSLGTGLFLLMLLPLMVWKFSSHYQVPVFFLSVICIIGTMYVVSGPCQTNHLAYLYENQSSIKDKDGIALLSVLNECTKLHSKSECYSYLKYNSASTANGKVHSFKDRFDGMLIAWNYLKSHVMGTGTGLGMSSVNAIAAGTSANAEGYVVAILEAGVVGGLFYLCLFTIMGWLAIKAIVSTAIDSFDDRVMVVVALSVCGVLVMGSQRIQPDITLWHMWIYAMWFYLLQKMPNSKVVS
jgi:hypothetical protein